jgi:hypothetical protein
MLEEGTSPSVVSIEMLGVRSTTETSSPSTSEKPMITFLGGSSTLSSLNSTTKLAGDSKYLPCDIWPYDSCPTSLKLK